MSNRIVKFHSYSPTGLPRRCTKHRFRVHFVKFKLPFGNIHCWILVQYKVLSLLPLFYTLKDTLVFLMIGVTERNIYLSWCCGVSEMFKILWESRRCFALDSWSAFWEEPLQGKPIAPFKEVLVPTLWKRHMRLWTSNWFSVNTSLT